LILADEGFFLSIGLDYEESKVIQVDLSTLREAESTGENTVQGQINSAASNVVID
jgi:hypothetical protein